MGVVSGGLVESSLVEWINSTSLSVILRYHNKFIKCLTSLFDPSKPLLLKPRGNFISKIFMFIILFSNKSYLPNWKNALNMGRLGIKLTPSTKYQDKRKFISFRRPVLREIPKEFRLEAIGQENHCIRINLKWKPDLNPTTQSSEAERVNLDFDKNYNFCTEMRRERII